MITQINSVNENWSISTNDFGGVVTGIDEINQTIGLILSTKKGTDPFRPTFGSDIWDYIDSPINTAGANISRAITEAIERWESRIKIISINYKTQPQEDTNSQIPSGLIFEINWQLTEGTDQQIFDLSIGVDFEEQIIRILGFGNGNALQTSFGQLIRL